MNYDHNKKFGQLKFHLGYGKFYLNSPKGYSRKIINAQTEHRMSQKTFGPFRFITEVLKVAESVGEWRMLTELNKIK